MHTSFKADILSGVSANYVDQETHFPAIRLSPTNLPGFSSMLAAGKVNFRFLACDDQVSGYSHVRIKKVSACPQAQLRAAIHQIYA
jgi:hypothetical protein